MRFDDGSQGGNTAVVRHEQQGALTRSQVLLEKSVVLEALQAPVTGIGRYRGLT